MTGEPRQLGAGLQREHHVLTPLDLGCLFSKIRKQSLGGSLNPLIAL